MSATCNVANALSTGSAALIQIDVTSKTDDDRAIVITTAGAMFYSLDEDSGAPTDSPDIIVPSVGTVGDKRWILQYPKGKDGCDFLTGNTGTTKTWFYLDTAPTGWQVDGAVTDCVLACAGGSNAYDVAGGTTPVAATWTQLTHSHTVDAHAHGLNSHYHSQTVHAHGLNSHTHDYGTLATAASATGVQAGLSGGNAASGINHTHTISGATAAASGDTANSGAVNTGNATGDTATGTSATNATSPANTWRPAGAVGKIFTLSV